MKNRKYLADQGLDGELLTAIGFIRDRMDWLEVAAIPPLNGSGHGYDIVLRLDGTYYDGEPDGRKARLMVEFFGAWVREVLEES